MPDSTNKPVETKQTPIEQVPLEEARKIDIATESETAKEKIHAEPAKETPKDTSPVPKETPPPSVPIAPVVPAAPAKDPVTAQIESILSEDLTDVFLEMTPEKQGEFKQKGEETAGKIRSMVETAKENARKIFDLIRDWLRVIPGVNRFFLEQEAKIKTDKILRLKP